MDTEVGPILDAQARSAYAQRLRDLREELHEAEAHNDIGRGERIRAEIKRIRSVHPALGRHHSPERDVVVKWEL